MNIFHKNDVAFEFFPDLKIAKEKRAKKSTEYFIQYKIVKTKLRGDFFLNKNNKNGLLFLNEIF